MWQDLRLDGKLMALLLGQKSWQETKTRLGRGETLRKILDWKKDLSGLHRFCAALNAEYPWAVPVGSDTLKSYSTLSERNLFSSFERKQFSRTWALRRSLTKASCLLHLP